MPKENNYEKIYLKNPNFTVLDRLQRDRDVIFGLIFPFHQLSPSMQVSQNSFWFTIRLDEEERV